jgi:hypothetical protein
MISIPTPTRKAEFTFIIFATSNKKKMCGSLKSIANFPLLMITTSANAYHSQACTPIIPIIEQWVPTETGNKWLFLVLREREGLIRIGRRRELEWKWNHVWQIAENGKWGGNPEEAQLAIAKVKKEDCSVFDVIRVYLCPVSVSS